jgi:hypothetical protein
MIQIKRGSTKSWLKQKEPLAEGQPGYDKDTHKIKIGDGKKSWLELPDASGISLSEMLSSEEAAKARRAALLLLSPLAALLDNPVITYGEDDPDNNTLGQLYLQIYDDEPEVDYVVDSGISNGWSYKKWKSGFVSCSRAVEISTTIQTAIDDSKLYKNTTEINKIKYPFTFKEAPSELASVQSPGGLVWLAASKGLNTTTQTAAYNILSADKLTNTATYRISLKVEGFLK